MIASWNSWGKRYIMKLLPKLEDIYYEALFPLDVDYDSGYDQRNDRYTNNLVVHFAAYGYTISRTLEELCKAAHVPFVEISFDNSITGKVRRELIKARRITITSYISRLIDRRSPSESWCVCVCAALLKLVSSQPDR